MVVSEAALITPRSPGITADIVNMTVLNKFGFNDIPENNSFTSFSILFR